MSLKMTSAACVAALGLMAAPQAASAAMVLTFQVNVTGISDYDSHLLQDGSLSVSSSSGPTNFSFIQKVDMAAFAFQNSSGSFPDGSAFTGQQAYPNYVLESSPVLAGMLSYITHPTNDDYDSGDFHENTYDDGPSGMGFQSSVADLSSQRSWHADGVNPDGSLFGGLQQVQTFFASENFPDRPFGATVHMFTDAEYLASLIGRQFGFSTSAHVDDFLQTADGVTLVNTTTITGRSGTATLLSISGLSSGAPEPAAWGLMVLGFGGLGAALRRRSALAASHRAHAAT